MEIKKLSESLSPNERRILPYLQEDISEICKKSNLDRISVLRALEFLQNKGVVNISYKTKKIVEIGVNGALYKKVGLPERRLLEILNEKRILSLKEAKENSKLSDEEFKASIGVLKKKAMIKIRNEKIILIADKKEISKKTLEEIFLELLPLEYSALTPEQLYSFKALEKRKDIIQLKEDKTLEIEITDTGKKIVNLGTKEKEMIEQITPEILKKESLWKGKKFRRYDLTSNIPKIHGGKEHFVNQAIDYGRKIWTELGFKEMSGNLIQSSFWVFDALFTAQDHPVREMQDTFFISSDCKTGNIPNKKLIKNVKKSHESGVDGSKGWNYNWSEKESQKPVLRTHTTCLSAQTLANLANLKNNKKSSSKLKGKFFAIGPCFRNETIDSRHLFEFNQTEGIVVDKNVNFNHLLGYLKIFLNKMGFEKIRFRPHFFPYTEPSVEADVYDKKTGKWTEILGAGILRPEVVVPLLGEYIPVLAWGMGFDRIIMSNYEIKDIRELYKNDLTKLREIKFWMK